MHLGMWGLGQVTVRQVAFSLVSILAQGPRRLRKQFAAAEHGMRMIRFSVGIPGLMIVRPGQWSGLLRAAFSELPGSRTAGTGLKSSLKTLSGFCHALYSLPMPSSQRSTI